MEIRHAKIGLYSAEATSRFDRIFNHPNLSFDELEGLISVACRRYFLRMRFEAGHVLRFPQKAL
jgi:hypothetical protein